MNKSFNVVAIDVGGFEKLPCLKKDSQNYINKAQHLCLGEGGVEALSGYFSRMQYKNEGFFYL